MRKFKFRVWDKRIKEMGEVTELRFSKVQHHLVKYRYIDKSGKMIDEQSHFDERFRNGLDIMQYTGLKDSFSKEIYEGDIIEKQGSKVETGIYEIGFEEGSFMASGRKGIDWWDDLCDIIWCQSGEVVKVIGNIYENPELIEGDKE